MARIQILQLPPYGKDGEQSFALVVDKCTPVPPLRYVTGTAESPDAAKAWQDVAAEHNADVNAAVPMIAAFEQARWAAFAQAIGARGAIFTCETVELADDTDVAVADGPRTEVHHWHFKDATLDHGRLQAWADARDARRGDELA